MWQSVKQVAPSLQKAASGLKQWALYHYIANLGDGTADTDGWLKMTVQWWWFQTHCSEIQSTSQKGQSFPFLWWLVAQTAVSLWFSSPGFHVSRTYLPMLYTVTHLTRWKERGTMRFISELISRQPSLCALLWLAHMCQLLIEGEEGEECSVWHSYIGGWDLHHRYRTSGSDYPTWSKDILCLILTVRNTCNKYQRNVCRIRHHFLAIHVLVCRYFNHCKLVIIGSWQLKNTLHFSSFLQQD